MGLQIQHKANDVPDRSYVMTLIAEDEAVKRKCQDCKQPTIKTVLSIVSHVENVPDFKAHRKVYVCSECGNIDVQS